MRPTPRERAALARTRRRNRRADVARGPRTSARITALGTAGLAACLVAFTVPTATATVATDGGAAGFGGFSSAATAAPLRIEVHEPTIPIPADPQVELNAFYTHVQGSSGPDASARASALWPGDSVGTGLKTIGDQLGLPSALTAHGYPVQANARTPGGPAHASQEPLPGLVARSTADGKHSSAKAGISPDGDVPQATSPTGGSGLQGLLGGLTQGNLSSLGDLLGGGQKKTATPNPLGALGLLVSADAVSSVSSTDYSGDTVTARATSRIAGLRLLAGLIRLDGVEVSARTTSNVHGSTTHQQVHLTGLSIAGKSFTIGPDGIEAAGHKTALPGLPDTLGGALKALGVSFGMPKTHKEVKGSAASMTVRGPRITIDTSVLRSKLPKLPLDKLVGNLPASLGPLRTVLGMLTQAAPKFVIYLGSASAKADTVPRIPPPDVQPSTASAPPVQAGGPSSSTPSGAVTSGGVPSAPVASAGGPVTSRPPTVSPPIRSASATPGLPPLGNVPTLLCLAGLALAVGAGWGLRRVGMVLLGVNATCSHGLKSGVPDLRKV